jgi:hypothetical protein
MLLVALLGEPVRADPGALQSVERRPAPVLVGQADEEGPHVPSLQLVQPDLADGVRNDLPPVQRSVDAAGPGPGRLRALARAPGVEPGGDRLTPIEYENTRQRCPGDLTSQSTPRVNRTLGTLYPPDGRIAIMLDRYGSHRSMKHRRLLEHGARESDRSTRLSRAFALLDAVQVRIHATS